MNQNEQRYAMDRVKQVTNQRAADLRKKFTKAPKEVTDEQRLLAIYEGDVLLKAKVSLDTTLREAYDFRRLRPKAIENTGDLEIAMKLLNEKAAVLKDEIMLGDGAKAVKLLKEWCQSC